MEETWIDLADNWGLKNKLRVEIYINILKVLKRIKNSVETRRKRNLKISEEIIQIKCKDEKTKLTVSAQKNNVESFYYIVNLIVFRQI